MITARNTAVLLLIVQVVVMPALGIDGTSEQLQELELGVARQAMKLIELEHLCDELAAEISGASANQDVMDSLASLSDRLEEVSLTLHGLETQVDGTSISESEARLTGIREDIGLLIARNAALSDRVQALKTASAPPSTPLGGGDGAAPDPLSGALNRVACALLILSQEMRGGLDISTVIGGGLGTLARLGDASETELPAVPGPGLVVMVFTLLLAAALVSMAAQGHYRREFSPNSATLPRLGRLHRSRPAQKQDIISPVDRPFWDAFAKARSAPTKTTGMSTDADQEYVQMLLKLGYREEAIRLASPRVTNEAPAQNRAVPHDPAQRKVHAKAVERGGGKSGGHPALAPAKNLYKQAFNSIIIAGKRSRRYKMRARRRPRKQP